MSFNYDKISAKRQMNESFWATYADLYLMLAIVFLMMYVATSLRTGAQGLQQKVQFERLAMEAEDLREQTKVYNTLKDDYLEKEASQDEQQVYKELMDKLNLLQDNAKKEKIALRKKAKENEKKEFALNKYQQIIRNIINTNMLAKAGLKTRDEVIETKRQTIKEQVDVIQDREREILEKASTIASRDSTIATQQDEISQKEKELKNSQSAIAAKAEEVEDLQKTIAAKQKVVAENESKMKGLNADLASKIGELEAARDAKQLSDAKASEQIAALKADAEGKIAGLKGQADAAGAALAHANGALAAANAEKEGLKADANAQRKALGDQIAALGDKIAAAEGKLAEAGENEKKYKDYIDQLKKEKQGLSGDLAKAKKQLDQKKSAAQKIKAALEKSGVKAEVDPNSGDVFLAFGDEYFDTSKADLKPGMKKILGKAMPSYSEALFKDKRFASSISSVEIIGFASPTYKGKYVDPTSLSEEDRAAVTYNLDLSYNRAKSIFSYVFDQKNMKFRTQKQLLPLVKVSGRSYLHEGIEGRDAASGISIKEYCEKFDCKKAQKVIIKFNLKD